MTERTTIEISLTDFIDLLDEWSEKTANRVIAVIKANEKQPLQYSINQARQMLRVSHSRAKALANAGKLQLTPTGHITRQSLEAFLQQRSA
jgi:hypothetical protein